ncbi:MAG TPA: head GIN domain-containing protein [Draconibacterium sp.]|nr:head GIN domain-containing protein [Draconibacterium sp.]
MKLYYFLFTLSLIVAVSNVSFGQDDEWETKTYQLNDFREIYLKGGYKVYLIQGNENSLTVKASDDKVFDYLKIRNNRSSLGLEIDRERFNFDRVNLYITFKNIERVEIEGGVRLKTKGYLDLNDIYVSVEGGAKIELDMKARNVEVNGEGGVLFELNGVAEQLKVHLSGAGHVDASELKTKNVTFHVEGVGTGIVYATETLHAQIEGVGKVKYRGNPEVTKDIEGLGSVSRD